MKTSDLNRLIRLLKLYRKETSSREADSLLKTMENITSSSKAGRKPKYTEETKKMILRLRHQNLSVRKIASAAGCSVGYAHQVLKANEAGIHKGEEYE